jgi:hypothetical protein
MNKTITSQNIQRGNGYGQYIVTGIVNGVDVTAHTTNSEAFDWFDDDSNDEKHIDAIYYVDGLLVSTYENI